MVTGIIIIIIIKSSQFLKAVEIQCWNTNPDGVSTDSATPDSTTIYYISYQHDHDHNSTIIIFIFLNPVLLLAVVLSGVATTFYTMRQVNIRWTNKQTNRGQTNKQPGQKAKNIALKILGRRGGRGDVPGQVSGLHLFYSVYIDYTVYTIQWLYIHTLAWFSVKHPPASAL